MRHILIIFIIFLFSSHVFGESKTSETLYRWNKSIYGQYFVWKVFGDKATHPKYTCDVKNGKPNGLGVIIYPDGIWKGGNKYVGEWKNGKEHGQGTLTTPVVDSRSFIHHGRKYVGEWKNGKHWNGTTEKDGKIEKKVVNGKEIK